MTQLDSEKKSILTNSRLERTSPELIPIQVMTQAAPESINSNQLTTQEVYSGFERIQLMTQVASRAANLNQLVSLVD